ncbi:MAG TPA: hypothetical protein DD000_04035 [Cyanobacteria bacterium UBA11166]|nr:hypothetical protein [Cyanobacteria bacterium UBA11166]
MIIIFNNFNEVKGLSGFGHLLRYVTKLFFEVEGVGVRGEVWSLNWDLLDWKASNLVISLLFVVGTSVPQKHILPSTQILTANLFILPMSPDLISC